MILSMIDLEKSRRKWIGTESQEHQRIKISIDFNYIIIILLLSIDT